MALYAFTAVTRSGRRISGVEPAASREEIISHLAAANALPVRISETQAGRPVSLYQYLSLWRRSNRRVALVITAEMSALIGAGLTVDRALTIVLDRLAHEPMKQALGRVREDVRRGNSLAAAMSAESAVFSNIYIALVKAGENSGHLDDALARLHAYTTKSDAIRDQIRSALVYPLILLTVGGGALLLLSNLVLPQFVAMFAEAHKSLPLSTRIVLAGNYFIGFAWPYLLAATAMTFAFGKRFFAEGGLPVLKIHRLALAIPLFGDLWKNIETARMARTMATLLQCGVSIPIALALAIQAVSNAVIRQGGSDALARIREGAAVSEAMLRAGVFPDLSIQLLAVGEETGRLDTMLLKQAELLEETCNRRVATLLALLVPGLTIGIGLLVASVMAAVMAAVLQLNDIVG